MFIKSVDTMSSTQDRAKDNPANAAEIDAKCKIIKSIGAEYVAVSTPYDYPSQANDWATGARNNGLKVWHRHSWASDEGWYGVPKNTANNRIADTVDWMKNNSVTYPNLFKSGDIFCPKPEPQNMGINGVNTGGGGRFAGKTEFNKWLRDIMAACAPVLPQGVQIGYWGFDGFITCGYDNPDWQGKSFLEPATVQAMGNVIASDHYPSGKPMSDFIKLFKQTWPGVNLVLGEYGTTQTTDKVTQLQGVINDVKADPTVIGMNYWELGPAKSDVRLVNDDLTLNPTGQALKTFFSATVTPPPPPPPPTTDLTTLIDLEKQALLILNDIVDNLVAQEMLDKVKTTVLAASSSALKTKLRTLLGI